MALNFTDCWRLESSIASPVFSNRRSPGGANGRIELRQNSEQVEWNRTIEIDTVKLTSAVALATSQALSPFVFLSARSTVVYSTVAAAGDGRRGGFMGFAGESRENRRICSLHDGPLRGPLFVLWVKWDIKSKLRTSRWRQSAYWAVRVAVQAAL
jgi:hypothetical protein